MTDASAGGAPPAAGSRADRRLPDITDRLPAPLGETARKAQSRPATPSLAFDHTALDTVQAHDILNRGHKAGRCAAATGRHTAIGFDDKTVIETKSIQHVLA